MVKISFIIPVYNVEKYLSACLDSLLVQAVTDWEAILVDDGSSDASGEICDRYAAKDGRFQVIHTPNQGAAKAREIAFHKSTGEYISFIDSDDWIAADTLPIVCSWMKKEEPDVIVMKMIDSGKTLETTRNFVYAPGCYDRQRLRREVYPSLLASPHKSVSEIPGGLCGKFIRTALLCDNMQYIDHRLRMGEDQVWLWPVMMQAERVVFCAQGLYFYRHFPEQTTRQYHERIWQMYSRVIAALHEADLAKREATQFDFSAQIDIMQAEFAINSIDNEFFQGAKGIGHAYRTIREIAAQEDVQKVLCRIPMQAFGRRKIWLQLLSRKRSLLLLLLELLNAKLRR